MKKLNDNIFISEEALRFLFGDEYIYKLHVQNSMVIIGGNKYYSTNLLSGVVTSSDMSRINSYVNHFSTK